MKLHLNETEIFTALREYIENIGLPISGMDVDIHMIAGRGKNSSGFKADITLSQPQDKTPDNSPEVEAEAGDTEDEPAVKPFEFGDED